jgi:hypothetical protein
MAAESFTRRADLLIAKLATCQHGVVARRQLLDAGVTRHQLNHRLRNGRLHEIHRGVYLVGHTVPTRYGRDAAALLACGPDAVLSHRSAAVLWGLLEQPAIARPCVTVPPGRVVVRPGINVHRAALDRRDLRRRQGLVLTSPPRTIFDLAAEQSHKDLEWLVAEATSTHSLACRAPDASAAPRGGAEGL